MVQRRCFLPWMSQGCQFMWPQEKGFPGSAYGTSKTLMTQAASGHGQGGQIVGSPMVFHAFPMNIHEQWQLFDDFGVTPKVKHHIWWRPLYVPHGARLHLQHCFVLFVLGSVEQTWPRDAAPSWAARHFIASLKVAIYWFPLKAHFV